MTAKEEAQLKRIEKLKTEKERTAQMKSIEMDILNRCCPENGNFLICGIDEAGRGPFAGPVVAGAVILDLKDPEKEILYINDSKKLSEKKRETLFKEIISKAVAVGIGMEEAPVIDEINILQATYSAMRKAVGNLTDAAQLAVSLGTDNISEDSHEIIKRVTAYLLSKHDRVVPDYILADAVHIPEIEIEQQGIIKGDAKSISIAAASIIAKVTRDHIMYDYDQIYPEYGFSSNKGYGTAAHIAAIKMYGMTGIHRRSFVHLDR